jgi:hypothetical protein
MVTVEPVTSLLQIRRELKEAAAQRITLMAESAQRVMLAATMVLEFSHLRATLCAGARESFERGLIAVQYGKMHRFALVMAERKNVARRLQELGLGHAPRVPARRRSSMTVLSTVSTRHHVKLPDLTRISSMPVLPRRGAMSDDIHTRQTRQQPMVVALQLPPIQASAATPSQHAAHTIAPTVEVMPMRTRRPSLSRPLEPPKYVTLVSGHHNPRAPLPMPRQLSVIRHAY